MMQLDSIEQLVVTTVTEQTLKRQHVEVSNKQLLKLLTHIAGYSAVRLTAVNKLEIWLQNPKVAFSIRFPLPTSPSTYKVILTLTRFSTTARDCHQYQRSIIKKLNN